MKIEVGKQPLQQGCDRPSPGGKGPAAVEVVPESLTRPGVEQNVAGSRVKPRYGPCTGKIGQIGYTAEIDDDAGAARVSENSRVKRRDQGGTRPTPGEVAGPEIGGHPNARRLGHAHR